jgi:hypothetical protein
MATKAMTVTAAGRKGGAANTAKQNAARAQNGQKGGRPRERFTTAESAQALKLLKTLSDTLGCMNRAAVTDRGCRCAVCQTRKLLADFPTL